MLLLPRFVESFAGIGQPQEEDARREYKMAALPQEGKGKEGKMKREEEEEEGSFPSFDVPFPLPPFSPQAKRGRGGAEIAYPTPQD